MPEVDLIPLEQFERAMIEGAKKALRKAAEDLKREAEIEAPVAPAPYKWYHPLGTEIGPKGGRYDWVLPGRLEASIRVEPAEGVREVSDHVFEAEVRAGNEEVKYAAVQHERLDFKHTKGKAKYLEDPLKTFRERLPVQIGEEVSAELRVVGKEGKTVRKII